jgi:phage terminase large subunit
MSTEYDLIFVQEATDVTQDDWEKMDSRLRNGRVSFQQLLADCNPQQPSHWLKRQCDDGSVKMLYSRHEDNPRYFRPDGSMTPQGEAYIARLDALTGVRKLRLRHGQWAAAEGIIYEEWRPEVHVVDRTVLPLDWPRYWAVDFGYTNPFVWQMWAVDPDGRAYLEREIYRTKRLVEDHAKDILHVVVGEAGRWKYPKPSAIICDHDAEDRATLERHLGMSTIAANKNVSEGIQAFQARVRVAGDGLPRVFVLRDSLVERDEELKQAGAPTCFAEEIEGYVWKPKPSTSIVPKPEPDEPLKKDDHAMDCARYLGAHLDLAATVRIRFIN